MDTANLRSLIERIPSIRHPCDLDVLLFFYRHPASLLTSEQLVSLVGYERKLVASTLDGLIGAGLLSRSLNPSLAARRLYELQTEAAANSGLLALLKIAATRPGRQELIRLLRASPPPHVSPGIGLRERRVLSKKAPD